MWERKLNQRKREKNLLFFAALRNLEDCWKSSTLRIRIRNRKRRRSSERSFEKRSSFLFGVLFSIRRTIFHSECHMTSSIIDQIVAKRIHSPISFWGRGSKPVLTKKNAFTFSDFPLFLNHIARGSALGPFTLKSWSWKVSPPFEISHALFETKLALFTFIELGAGGRRGLRLWISSSLSS